MKHILLLSIFISLYAQNPFGISSPASVEILNYDSIGEDEPEDLIVIDDLDKKNSNELLKDVIDTKKNSKKKQLLSKSNSIFLALSSYPKKVILNQRFFIDIKATVAIDGIDTINTLFLKSKSFKILNPDSPWLKSDNQIYTNRYYLQFLTTSPEQPIFTVEAKLDGEVLTQDSIELPSIGIKTLAKDDYFSGVIAENMILDSHSQKKYDSSSNIVLLELSATNSNLSDFNISYSLREGIDEFIDNDQKQKIFYFATIRDNLKYFKFTYFNPITNKYKQISFPIKLQDQTLSTQTELNPKKNRYILYKTIALLIAAFLLLLLFVFQRSYLALLFALIFIAYVVYTNISFDQIYIKKGTQARILPTKNSTVFYIFDRDSNVDVLNKRGDYIKVLTGDSNIGWVDKNDL
jgi:hypothetical protein